MIPIRKWVTLSISPFRDFLLEIRKQIKGTRRVTRRYASNEMFRGRELFAI